jgi:serine/threonine protein kinase
MRAANVLVNGQGRAMLADFGLSPLKAADPSLRDNTKRGPDGRIRPRPARWMSPEVMRGEEWDMSADMYSLGMTLYEVRSIITALAH